MAGIVRLVVPLIVAVIRSSMGQTLDYHIVTIRMLSLTCKVVGTSSPARLTAIVQHISFVIRSMSTVSAALVATLVR